MKLSKNMVLGYAAGLAAEFLYGISFLFTKEAIAQIDGLTMLAWRFILAFILMTILILLRVVKVDYRGKNVKALGFIGILYPLLYFIGETLGIANTTTAESGCIIAGYPILTLIASALIIHKKPKKNEVAGILITITGVVTCVLVQGATASFSPFGYAMIFMGITAYSISSVFVEKLTEFNSWEKTYAMLMMGAVSFSAMAVFQYARQKALPSFFLLPATNMDFLVSVLALGIGCSIVSVSCSNLAIATIGANKTATLVGISTVVTIVSGVIVLHEHFSLWQGMGALLILAGVYIANVLGHQKS